MERERAQECIDVELEKVVVIDKSATIRRK